MSARKLAQRLLGIVLIYSITSSATPPALPNCGNTCFLNASLQALLNIPGLLLILHESPTVDLFAVDTHPTAYYFTQLAQQYLDGNSSFSCNTDPLKSLFTSAYNEFFEARVCSQQDAGEFIVRFLTSCISHAITDEEAILLADPLIQLQEQLKQNPQSRTLKQKIEQTRIKQLFHSIYSSRITCPATTASPSPLIIDTAETGPSVLTVPAVDTHQTPLTDLAACLTEYFKAEQLDAYTDNTGTQRTDCIKQLYYLITPPYLCINVNRYTYAAQAQHKVNHTINIPLTLDLSAWVRPPHPELVPASKTSPHYELISAIVQGGGVHGGHFWAYVKKEQTWYRCDDSTITPIGATLSADATIAINGTATGPSGYFFVYQRQSAELSEKPMHQPQQSTTSLTQALDTLAQALNHLAGIIR